MLQCNYSIKLHLGKWIFFCHWKLSFSALFICYISNQGIHCGSFNALLLTIVSSFVTEVCVYLFVATVYLFVAMFKGHRNSFVFIDKVTWDSARTDSSICLDHYSSPLFLRLFSHWYIELIMLSIWDKWLLKIHFIEIRKKFIWYLILLFVYCAVCGNIQCNKMLYVSTTDACFRFVIAKCYIF